MPVKKLTEKAEASAVDRNSTIIVTTKDVVGGTAREKIEKAPLDMLAEAIKAVLLNRKLKGYYYSHIDLKNKKIYLTDWLPNTLENGSLVAPETPDISLDGHFYIFPIIDVEFESGYEVGQKFSINNGEQHNLVGTITAIEGNEITYEGDLGFEEVVIPDERTVKDYMFFVPTAPEAGLIEFDVTGGEFGTGTVAGGEASIAIGRFNKLVDAILMIGNGTSDADRHNALVLDWDGNLRLSGDVLLSEGISLSGVAESLGDVGVALDRIVAIQEAFIDKSKVTIQFLTTDDTILTAKVDIGMTWAEAIETEEVKALGQGFVIGDDGYVRCYVMAFIKEADYEGDVSSSTFPAWCIKGTDKVKDGQVYVSSGVYESDNQ